MASKTKEAPTIRAFELELARGIPDPGHLGLAARCGGDVRDSAFEAAAQVLRVIAAFPAGAVRVGLYFQLNPTRPRAKRTRVRLVGHCRDADDQATASALGLLFQAGPLQAAYGDTLKPLEKTSRAKDWIGLGDYRYCQRLLRRESIQPIRPEMRQTNHRLVGLRSYLAVHPFAPREDNDWLGLDRLFDQLHQPAMVEILVGPHAAAQLREAHFDYAHRLAQVNAFDSPLDRPFFENVRRTVLDKLQQDPQADYFSQLNEDLTENLRQPQLMFTIRCWSACPVEGRLLASLVAEECFEEGSYQFQIMSGEARAIQTVSKAACGMAIRALKGREQVAEGELARRFTALNQLPTVCTADELASVFRLPIARHATAPRTFSLHTDPKPVPVNTWTDDGQPDPRETSLLIGEDLEVAPATLTPACFEAAPELKNWFHEPDSQRAEIRLQRKHLQKHLFVCGVPGSGKTTAMFNLVAQLHYQGTPFLIIEPAKTEYRMFKKFGDHPDPKIRELARELRVYTLGDERVSPLRFNPLKRGEGVSLEEHMSALMDCFKGAMPLGEGPLESILQEALERVLTDPPAGRQPRLSDLVNAARDLLTDKGYDSEITSNLRAAIDVRLGLLTRGSLGRMLECDEDIPTREELFSKPVVLEMDSLSQAHACLMTLLILTALRQRLRAESRSGAPLKHVVLLEEAHNIVGRSGNDPHGMDPRSHAAEYIVRMLAEVRALGEGMIIADQLPSAVAPEVIKNTGSKLALRLVANDDREELGGTMLLDETGIAELARCSIGTGFFYTEGYYRPRRVQTFNSHALLGLTRKTRTENKQKIPISLELEPPDCNELGDLIGTEPWFQDGDYRRRLHGAIETLRLLEASLASRQSELESARDHFLEARAGWLQDSRSDPLRAELLSYREALDQAGASLQEALARACSDLTGFGADPERSANCKWLIHQVNRVFVNGILKLVALHEQGRMVVATGTALLREPEEDPPAFPAWLEPIDESELGLWFLNRLREVLQGELELAHEEWSELAEFSFPEPPKWPEEIPDDCSDEEFVAHFQTLKRNATECLKRCDNITGFLGRLSASQAVVEVTTNPFLAVDGFSVDAFSDLVKKIAARREVAWQLHYDFCIDIRGYAAEMRRMRIQTGQLDESEND